jgi:hypothetical protein
MFHPPKKPNDSVNGRGYVSIDGHLFECDPPVQAFHVYASSFYAIQNTDIAHNIGYSSSTGQFCVDARVHFLIFVLLDLVRCLARTTNHRPTPIKYSKSPIIGLALFIPHCIAFGLPATLQVQRTSRELKHGVMHIVLSSSTMQLREF